MLRRITLLLIGGAALNLVVAFGLGLAWRPGAAPYETTDEFAGAWPAPWPDESPFNHPEVQKSTPTHRSLARRFGASWLRYGAPVTAYDPSRIATSMGGTTPAEVVIVVVETGWPMRFLRGVRFVSPSNFISDENKLFETLSLKPLTWESESIGLMEIPFVAATRPPNASIWPPVVPYHVEPVAFAANTLLFAAILWTPGALRRLRRRRRSRCEACGYDLHEIDVCPECGREKKIRGTAQAA